MKKPHRSPDVNKASTYAIVVNAIQIAALAVFVLYLILHPGYSDGRLLFIVAVIALMAIWGASIDIHSALQTRRRVRTIQELQTTNGQMDALNLKLRAQRHDFLNHIQVVYSLLEMGESGEAADYLERVYSQLRTVSKVMRTKVTAFNALLQVKNAACEEKGSFSRSISAILACATTLVNSWLFNGALVTTCTSSKSSSIFSTTDTNS